MFSNLFSNNSYKTVSPQQIKTRMDAGERFVLLDVRTPEEYEEIHIPKSISLPLSHLKSGISKVADPDTEIVVYCLSGARAVSACQQLAAMGYRNISCMGGIRSWRYETERGIA